MTTININTGENVDLLVFPDGQPHVKVKGVAPFSRVKVVCSITDTVKLIQLLEVSDAILRLSGIRHRLVIPYLMGARYDREMIPGSGESVDLQVIANLINSMNFEEVYLYDVHSSAATQLISRSTNLPNHSLVMQYTKDDAVLICPDKGAKARVPEYVKWNKNLTDVVYCDKTRDMANGNITLTVLDPEKCKGRNCVIIDDLCDGGGTFLSIASQIDPAHLTLIVTHGIFSKGLVPLEQHFDEIIVSSSYKPSYDSPKVKVITY